MDYNDGGGAGALIAWLVIAPFFFLLVIAGYVIGSWFLMKIFDKAGVQGRWRAWVPVYNTLIFVKLGDLNPWWLLALWGGTIVLGWVPVLGALIGLATFLYTLAAAWRVGLKLQKEAVWLILYFFLVFVWLGINAFDRSRWNVAIPAAPWATSFLADKTVWTGVPSQVPAGGYPANPVTAPGYGPPPAGYQPPAGYSAPPAPPAGYTPPPAGPAAPVPPPATPPAAQPPVTPSAAQPPVTPPAAPAAPSAAEPPAAEPPTAEPPAPEPPKP